MPIYEYQCLRCNEIIELWGDPKHQDSEEEPICKKCKVNMPKIISQNNFHLKGSGWARDGYSKESK